jgi:hypothetical protein
MRVLPSEQLADPRDVVQPVDEARAEDPRPEL